MLGKKRGIRTIGAMVTFIPQRLEEFEPPAAGGLLAATLQLVLGHWMQVY